jgi:hypothetical protein
MFQQMFNIRSSRHILQWLCDPLHNVDWKTKPLAWALSGFAEELKCCLRVDPRGILSHLQITAALTIHDMQDHARINHWTIHDND